MLLTIKVYVTYNKGMCYLQKRYMLLTIKVCATYNKGMCSLQ